VKSLRNNCSPPVLWKSCRPWGASVGEPSQSALAGKRIVVTRPLAQSDGFAEALRASGAEPIILPLIKIVPFEDCTELDAALDRLRIGDWIFLTSQNAVSPVAQRGCRLRKDFFSAVSGIQIAAVGSATQRAAGEAGMTVQYVAKSHDGVSLANELGESLRGRKVLLPRSDIAGPELRDAIGRHGGEVIDVPTYRTELCRDHDNELKALVEQREVDAIVCFSPSAVRSLEKVFGAARLAELQNSVVFVAIGTVTEWAYNRAGVRDPLVASDTNAEAVVTVLHNCFASRVSGHFA
jgi:uroporphyrinogen III methyltransferase/synthase